MQPYTVHIEAFGHLKVRVFFFNRVCLGSQLLEQSIVNAFMCFSSESQVCECFWACSICGTVLKCRCMCSMSQGSIKGSMNVCGYETVHQMFFFFKSPIQENRVIGGDLIRIWPQGSGLVGSIVLRRITSVCGPGWES